MSEVLTTETNRLLPPTLPSAITAGNLYTAASVAAPQLVELPDDISFASPAAPIAKRKKRAFEKIPNYTAKLRARKRYTPLDRTAKKRKTQPTNTSVFSELLKSKLLSRNQNERVNRQSEQSKQHKKVAPEFKIVWQQVDPVKQEQIKTKKSPQKGILSRISDKIIGKKLPPSNPYINTGAIPRPNNPFASI